MTPSERKKRVDAVVKAANEQAAECASRVYLRNDTLPAFKAAYFCGFLSGYRMRMKEAKGKGKLVVDVAKLRKLFIEWHRDEDVDEDEAADYADRLIERIKKEA